MPSSPSLRRSRPLVASVLAALVVASLLAAPPAAARTASPLDALADAPRGVDPAYVPAYDVEVAVGQLSQALLNAHPEGTRFGLAAGVHRVTGPLRPRSRQQLLGFPGAVISGSKVVRTWYRSGGRYYASGQTQRLPRTGGFSFELCIEGRPFCNHGEDVFLDGQALTQVGSLDELEPGSFYFDYGRNRIYIGDDPRGHVIETTVANRGLTGGARGVVVRNVVVEKFGNPVQSAVIEGEDWVVQDNEVRLNHGGGVTLWGGRLVGNRVHSNGQSGVGGGGVGQLVEDNEVSYNNTQGYHPFEIAHATKWFRSTGLVVRGNWIHSNHASGLVTDVNNVDVLVEGNLVEDNEFTGLVHELGYDAVIQGNTIRDNGGGSAAYWFTQQLGIAIVNSRNTKVLDNLVMGNRGGGILAVQDTRITSPDNHPDHGSWRLEELEVRGNTVELVGDGSFGSTHTGFDVHPGVPDRASYYTERGNVFADNLYVLPSGTASTGRYFFWTDGGTGHAPMTYSEWQAAGFDRTAGGAEGGEPPAPEPGFVEGFAGADGAAWPAARWRIAAAGGTAEIRGGEGRLALPGGAPWATAHAVARTAPVGDQELTVRVRRVDTTRASGASFVWARADDALADPGDGIVVQHAWHRDEARGYVFARAGGTSVFLGELPGVQVTGRAFWLRVRSEGDRVSVKQWVDGAPEPVTWGLETGGVTLGAGVPRLSAGNGAEGAGLDVRFDELRVDPR